MIYHLSHMTCVPDHVAECLEVIEEVTCGHVVGNVEDEKVAALGALTKLGGLNWRPRPTGKTHIVKVMRILFLQRILPSYLGAFYILP